MRHLTAALAFFAALEPVSALALSCRPWSPTQAYAQADAAESRYSVVVGQFAFNGELPKSSTVVSARLSGRALAQSGFDAPWSEQVRLEVGCAASWCGSVQAGQPYLVFVEHTDAGLSVALPACPSVVFPNPTPAVERAITRCLASGGCDTN